MKRDWFTHTHSSWTLALPLLVCLALLHFSTIPQRFNNWLYDSLITTFPAPLADDVAIVAIDRKSLATLGRWPWPRAAHAEVIRKLRAAGAKTIVFDVLFPEPAADDTLLAQAMSEHGQVILPLHFAPRATGQPISEALPVPQLSRAAAALGHAHVELDGDGLARGLYLYNGLGDVLWPSLSLAAARLSGVKTGFDHEPADSVSPYVNVRRDFVEVPVTGRAGSTLPTYSYVDVLNSPPETRLFAGKTVFVGATAPGFGDNLPTPFSGHGRPMSGVEFHANTYSALVTHNLIKRVDRGLDWWLPLLTIALLALVLPRLRPLPTLALCGSVFISLVLLMATALLVAHRHIPVASALFVTLIASPLWTTFRLAMTNQFLNRQLDELGRGEQLSLPEPWQRHPQQLLDQLKSLLQAQGWWLSRNQEQLAAYRMTANDRPPTEIMGQWQHRDAQSWIRLTRDEDIYELGLTLPADLTREASQRYLNRLTLDSQTTTIETDGVRDNFYLRIERVRRATERLSRMQAFIGRSFEKMPDGIIVADALGIIQFINGHIEEWFHEPRPSLIGMSLSGLLQGHDPRETPPWPETVAETLTQKQSRTVDLRVHGMDFLIHLAPFELPESVQSGIIANISNISELREQQRQHREAIDFISHDVRSPLVSQLALIEQLKRSPGEIQTHQLDQLGRLARRSYQLAEEFVQLARAEQLTETRFYECEFLAIVENARDSVIEQASEKGIRLQLQGTDDLWLNGNPELLERAVINLLTNAVQYSEPPSTVTIQVFRAGHQACLTVSDEGAGIADHEIPHLFDRYRRQKSSEISGNHGAGLGLSFVNVVVEKHRGEISVRSTEGVGSVFTLRLPVADPI